LAFNFLPVGKRGLAQTRAVDIIDILPTNRGILGLCCAAEDTVLVVTAEEPQVGGFANVAAGVMPVNRQNFQLPVLFDRIRVPDCLGYPQRHPTLPSLIGRVKKMG